MKVSGCPPTKDKGVKKVEQQITVDEPSLRAVRSTDGLGAPRLQLRWAAAEPNDRHMQWACHYELVLPLAEHDIRREVYGDDGEMTGKVDTLIVALKPPSLRGSSSTPCEDQNGERYCDPPFRDGSHSKWDAALLGDLPVYVIAPDGESFAWANAEMTGSRSET